jgi:hypothetical protein
MADAGNPDTSGNASPQAIGSSRANLAGARLLGGQSEAGLGIFAGTQPYHRAWSGIHPAMLRAYARAFVLSVIPGNRRRSPIAADNSPSRLKMARIAAASASVTTNIPRAW